VSCGVLACLFDVGSGRSGGTGKDDTEAIGWELPFWVLGSWALGRVAESEVGRGIGRFVCHIELYGATRQARTNHASGTNEEAPWCSKV
jgi:hypothetical protein